MFASEGSTPDILDIDDRAVRHHQPPVPIWVDLAALTRNRERGGPYGDIRPGGVFIEGLAKGVLWAWVLSSRAMWLAVATIELERQGVPVMTTPALVPDWAVKRRLPGSDRATHGKTSSRPTAAQAARRTQPGA